MEMDYEDVSLTDIGHRVYYCSDCRKEMVEVGERDAYCPRCGKRGWDVMYRCPGCGLEISRFRQDLLAMPPCHSCA